MPTATPSKRTARSRADGRRPEHSVTRYARAVVSGAGWPGGVEKGGPRRAQAPAGAGRSAPHRAPEALGYDTSLWTAWRVADLIERECRVQYHPGHVWWLLRKLGWSCQRPMGRAFERDETAIRQWKRQRWPTLKKRRARLGYTIVFVAESGLSARPLAVARGRRAGSPRSCSITSTGNGGRRWPGSRGGTSTSGCFRGPSAVPRSSCSLTICCAICPARSS
jgi:transposase